MKSHPHTQRSKYQILTIMKVVSISYPAIAFFVVQYKSPIDFRRKCLLELCQFENNGGVLRTFAIRLSLIVLEAKKRDFTSLIVAE